MLTDRKKFMNAPPLGLMVTWIQTGAVNRPETECVQQHSYADSLCTSLAVRDAHNVRCCRSHAAPPRTCSRDPARTVRAVGEAPIDHAVCVVYSHASVRAELVTSNLCGMCAHTAGGACRSAAPGITNEATVNNRTLCPHERYPRCTLLHAVYVSIRGEQLRMLSHASHRLPELAECEANTIFCAHRKNLVCPAQHTGTRGR